ncbi:MAG: phage head-tail connector protein [PVC group bacterium]|nr:phage head-tail connector protein [PVC group bacterium]
MIITLDEVKQFLQITDTSQDALISALIPPVQDWLVGYLNNYFEIDYDDVESDTGYSSDAYYYMRSSKLAFVSGIPATITDSQDGFIDAGFQNGMDIRVRYSLLNNGIYQVNNVAAGVLTLELGHSLFDEDNDLTVLLTWVNFPNALKPYVSNLINFHLNVSNDPSDDMAAESVGNHSITYGTMNSVGVYPPELLVPFRPWMLAGKI